MNNLFNISYMNNTLALFYDRDVFCVAIWGGVKILIGTV